MHSSKIEGGLFHLMNLPGRKGLTDTEIGGSLFNLFNSFFVVCFL